jgi:cytochrome c-type biogenesis protein CcmF
MVHTFIGSFGNLLLSASFVFSIFAAVLYFISVRQKEELKHRFWKINGRVAFFLHSLTATGVVIALFWIIYNHYFEYHYAWSHSSTDLPVHYMISSFWEGQEGSFLLWIFWHVLIGLFFIFTNKKWEAPVMAIFASVQAFLLSMILGVVVFGIKIGSSPFLLLREVMDDPIFRMNPDFIPANGTGLNPLLQNIWMVIHPPFLFIGFAATLVPFALLIAGLWQKKYSEWIRPALPWSIFAAGVLGMGIMMGAYWAYETLNFGGYWNWDPVENAVYVPWLILVGAIHAMNLYKKGKTGLKTSAILIISTFVLILYSTFLTRSGILGSSSNHAFTDLGLQGQLLLYLLTFLFVAVWILVVRWKEIPTTEKELSTWKGDFWVFIGVIVICLMAFQVLFETSYPVINSFFGLFGIETNLAFSATQEVHYSHRQLWFALVLAILTGTGQFFWWKRMSKSNLWDEMGLPVLITLILSILVILIGNVVHISYILLMTAAIYSLVINSIFFYKFMSAKKLMKLSGGAVAHIGIALMLIGIVFSSGYSSIISQNTSGRIYSRQFSEELNQNNVLLWLEEPLAMNNYVLTYKGTRVEPKGFSGYIDSKKLFVLSDKNRAIVLDSIVHKKNLWLPGDTLDVYGENTYFEVEFSRENGKSFTLFPRAQVNPNMGLIASPDVKKFWGSDLYTHVSSIPDPEQEQEWKEMEHHKLKPGDRFMVNDFVAELVSIGVKNDFNRVPLGPGDVAVSAKIRILGKTNEYLAEPIFFIKDNSPGIIPHFVPEMGARFSFINIDTETNEFTIGLETTQRDYIILKAMEKPHINILWIGTIVVLIGFGIAVYRRSKDGKTMNREDVLESDEELTSQEKGQEVVA